MPCNGKNSNPPNTHGAQVHKRADALLDEILTSLVHVACIRNQFVRTIDPAKLAKLEAVAAKAAAARAHDPLDTHPEH